MDKKQIFNELNDVVNKLSALHSEWGMHHLDIQDDNLVMAHNAIYKAFVWTMTARDGIKQIIQTNLDNNE